MSFLENADMGAHAGDRMVLVFAVIATILSIALVFLTN
jgi:hypothetical protein